MGIDEAVFTPRAVDQPCLTVLGVGQTDPGYIIERLPIGPEDGLGFRGARDKSRILFK